MPPPTEERRKGPSPETIENTVAIGKLVTLSGQTTKDVDRLVRHIEKFLPVHETIANIKKILYTFIAIASTFAIWITLEHFKTLTLLTAHIAVDGQIVIAKENELQINKKFLSDKINYNENQITYLKGRIKK